MREKEPAGSEWIASPRPAPPIGDSLPYGRPNPESPSVDESQMLFAALEPFAQPPPDSGGMRGQLAVICCYFNPCGYESLKRNYARFADGMRKQGVPLYTIELAFDDAPFFLPPADRIVQLRTTHVLWHKERLLNLLLARLPAQYDKVAWVDGDLLFENPDWVEQAAQQLDRMPVVQLFSEARYLDRDGRPYQARTGLACAVARKLPGARGMGRAPLGFAWVARRDLLARHGLFDSHIVGSGDMLMVLAMYGWWDHPSLVHQNDAMLRAFRQWGEPFYRDVGGRVGFVEGSVLHLWHGRLADRKYNERWRCLMREGFDPRTDIAAGLDGIWEWATEKPALHAALRNYFNERHEDE